MICLVAASISRCNMLLIDTMCKCRVPAGQGLHLSEGQLRLSDFRFLKRSVLVDK